MKALLPFDTFFGDRPTALSTDYEFIFDFFAGGGGASTGIEMALGRSPDFAINHDPEALALHEANHPVTVHLRRNVWQVDPFELIGNRPVGLCWFSPDCKHFSKAKGGKPRKREIRDLAWVVVQTARRVRPRVIILENVEEFRDWGPLLPDGQPCKERKGKTFKHWCSELKRLGYKIEWRELRACDYGAPTIRKRFFLIARRDGRPIVWPKPTHGRPDDPDVVAGKKLPWRTAAEIIDWSLPCHSIFLTREEARAVGVNRPLAEATMARIAKGVKRYVLEAEKPFIVTLNHQGDHFRGQDIDEPFKTVTSARDAHGLVAPVVVKDNFGDKPMYGMEEPAHTVVASGTHHALVSAGIVRTDMTSAYKRNGVHGPEEPIRTQATAGSFAIVGASVVGVGGRMGQSRPRSADEPVQTITAKADSVLVAPHMTKFNTGAVGSGVDEPVHTVTAAHSEYHPGAAVPLGVVAATMVQTGYGERKGQEPRALDVGKPLGTVVAGGVKHAAVSAFLAQHNLGVTGHDAREPMSTVTQTGSQQAVVSAGLLNQKGSDQRMADVDTPAPTVCAQGTHVAEVRAFLLKYYGTDQDPRLKEPLATVTTKERFGVVTVDGEDYVIADIGMRMLTPRELYRAQGFPDTYRIEIEFGGRPLPKSSQTRMCGNSVCPPLSRALVAANCMDLAVIREAAE